MNTWFFLNSILLGVGLAMDAFSVSIANGLAEHGMSRRRMSAIAGCYAFFQWAMPMIGWFCVHTISGIFCAFQGFIPWIALFLLLYIGGKMLIEGVRKKSSAELKEEEQAEAGTWISAATLLLQGVATSIDALSVGFTIASYTWSMALGAAGLIGTVTFLLCLLGLRLGRFLGSRVLRQSCIIGGVILIAVGLEIFLSHIL